MSTYKKKSSAEATANPKRVKYIRLKEQMQDGTHVVNLLTYLYKHKSITPMECYEKLNNTRISSTVSILRHVYGVPVKMEKVTKNGRTYGVYSITWDAIA